MIIFRNIILSISVLTLLFSCGAGNEKINSDSENRGHAHESENEVSLNDAQIGAIGLELGKIEQKELRNVIKANGFLKVPNQSKASVTSLYSGQIKSIFIRPGEKVGKGQQIALIENPNQVQVQEQYLTVVGQIQMAETEVKRQKELYEGNAGALKNLQYAESQLKMLRTQKASLVKQLQLMGISTSSISASNLSSTMTVRSPISGVVGAVLVDIGSYVDISSPIAEIIDNSDLHLDLNIFEKDLSSVQIGQTIHFTLTNNSVKEYDASIFSIGSAFEDNSKAIPVHAKVKGDKTGLIDGMNVVAIISIGESLVPAVPTESIVNSGAEDFIFILEKKDGSDNIYKKIPVVKGTTDVGYSQITPLIEIPNDSRVVKKGAFFLMAKMNNTGEEHDH
ncbi:MAG: efflux RND transporter periplasmic adaptor subunit [Flavobacteriia bacterium]|nr:efflux RND transporter periplasmic adaptor subunit [Flavobacteriia bacterium]